MASGVKHRDYLVELDWRVYDQDTGAVTSTTYYWSRFANRTHGGHDYIARVLSLGDITTPYIDRKDAHFDEVSIEISNLAEDISNDLPFQALRSEARFSMQRLRVYSYDVLAGTKRMIWWGYTKAISYNAGDFAATITGSFSWDSIKINMPKVMMGHRCAAGFPEDMTEMEPGSTNGCTWNGTTVGVAPTTGSATSCDKTWDGSNGCLDKGNLQQFLGTIKIAPIQNDTKSNWVDREKVRDSPFPIVYGVGDLKVKPEVYSARIKDGILMCNFFVSGCHAGQPFLEADIGSVRIGGAQKARFVKMYYGDAVQAIPANRSKFPDGLGHSHLLHGYAEFELTKPQVDKFASDVPFHLLTMRLKNGRKTKGGARTNNHVTVIVDMLQDPIFGMGIPDSDIDAAAVAAAAGANDFTGRFELDKQVKNQEWIQSMCGSFHGYVTFNDDKMQVGKKTNAETEVATFGTGGLRIVDWLEVDLEEDDVSELINTLNVRYRGKFREPKKFQFYDMQARRAAGNGIDTPVERDVFLEGIYDDYQAQVSAATLLREELNLTFKIKFTTSIDDWETGNAKTGQIIRVNSHHIPNNASNYWFRVTGVTYSEDEETVEVQGRVYKQAVYDFDTDTLGDVLTGPGDTSVTQTPPDVEDFTAVGRRVKDDEDDGYNEEIYCTWTYPGMDAGDQAELDEESVDYTEDVIEEVLLMWRYTDDQEFRLTTGITVRYPQAEGTFQVPFHRNRIVEVWAVSRGRNHGTGEVGYVKNSDKTDYLDGDVNDSIATWDLGDTALFANDDYVKCGTEYCRVLSKTATTLTLYNTAGVRDPYFNSDSLTHDDGTEVAVVEPSSPIAYVDMSVIRATLPVVTGVTTRSRPRGIRVHWDDVVMDHIQNHLVYWSVTGALDDADSWVTGWLPADPKSPTAGVNLLKTKATHILITQEMIDAAYGSDASGVEVQVRVSAKIKNNYSSELSALGSANGGHHNRPWAAPADPEVDTDLTQLIVSTSDRVQITVKVYATSDRVSLGARTFAQVNTYVIGLILEKYSKSLADWSGNYDPRSWDVEDPDATYQDCVFTLHKGSKWRIRRAFARNPGTRRVASTLDLDEIFQVGSQSDDLTGIVDLAIAPFVDPGDENTDSIELDGNDSQLLVTWTQPATPVTLRELQVRKKKDTATKWRRVPAVQLLDRVDDAGNPFNTTGAKVLRVDVHHPRGVTMDFEVRLVGADGDTTAWETVTRLTTDDAGGGDLPIRSDGHGPSYPSGPGNAAFETTGTAAALHRNHVIADGAKLQVEASFQLLMDGTGNDQNFGTPDATYGPVRDAVIILQKRNAANSANEGDPLRFKVGIDPNLGYSGAEFYAALRLEAGAIYDWPTTIYYNSSGELVRSSTAADTRFRAGRGSHQFNAMNLTSESLTRTDSTNNRNAILDLVFTQPATPVLLKRVVIEVTYNFSAGGAATWKKAKSENLLDDFAYVSATSGVKTLTFQVPHKKAQSDMGFRAILVPVNSDYGTTGISTPNMAVTTTSQSSTDDGYVTGSNPSGAATAPTFLKAYIGNGGLSARFAKPNDPRPTMQYYEFQFADNSSATLSTARDWLDPEEGDTAYTSVAPNVDAVNTAAVNLVNATSRAASGRFGSPDIRKRDLTVTFTSGTQNGTLTLFVRARVVDLDAAGALRFGDWSTFNAVVLKNTMDRDTDTPSRNHAAGTGNGFEGWGCSNSASQFPSAAGNHGTTAALGLNFYAQPKNNDEELTIRPHLAVLGIPGTMKYVGSGPGAYTQQSGNPWDTGNRGIYWDKSVPAISVYGNAGRTDYPIWNGLSGGSGGPTNVQPSINCRITGNVRVGETYWAVFSVAVANATNLPSIAGIVAKLWDRASGSARFTSTSMTWAFNANQTFKLMAIKVNIASTFTGNAWFQLTFPTWTQGSGHILYIANGIWRRGPTPPRVWVPGKYEANLDPVTGVTFSAFGVNLTTIDMVGGWSTDGITTYGELEL